MKHILKTSICITLLTLVGCTEKEEVKEEPSRIHLAEQEAKERKEKETLNLEIIRLYNTGVEAFRDAPAFYFTATFEGYDEDMNVVSEEYHTLADVGYSDFENASFIYETFALGTDNDFHNAFYFVDGTIYQNKDGDKHSFSHLSNIDEFREIIIDPETSNQSSGFIIPESSKELMTVTEIGDDYSLVWNDPTMPYSETTAVVSKSGRVKTYRIDYTDTSTLLPASYLFEIHDFGETVELNFPDLSEYPELE